MYVGKQKLIAALPDTLMLDWSDNDNISAPAVRDGCIQCLAEVMGLSTDQIGDLLEERISWTFLSCRVALSLDL